MRLDVSSFLRDPPPKRGTKADTCDHVHRMPEIQFYFAKGHHKDCIKHIKATIT